MPSVKIRRDDGSPADTEALKSEIASSDFALKIDGVLRTPAVVKEAEYENDGSSSATADQCGHTERQRTTNNGWAIRVQGIATLNANRRENLSMQLLRDGVANSNTVEVRSGVLSGEFEVSNVVITDASDLYSVQTRETNGEEEAVEFQLQLGQTESE